MEFSYLLVFLFTLLGFVPTQVVGQQGTAACPKSCFNATIPVVVTTTNLIYGLPPFANNLDVTALISDLNTRGFLESAKPFSSAENQTASHNISGTYCRPNGSDGSTLLLATHGLALDRYYWDLQYQPNNYSFVDFVADKGYSVFYYDRVGAGESSLISGYVAQYSIHVAVLEQIIGYIRNGSIVYDGSTISPEKIVLVGHSMGSGISNALLASNPTIADGAVLTGWSRDSGLLNPSSPGLDFASMGAKIAATVNPARFGAYDTGYLTFSDVYGEIQLYYKAPFFDFEVAQFSLATSWPVSITELVTIGVPNYVSQSTIPVLFQTGSDDFLICSGNCTGVFSGDILKKLFPNSVGLEVDIQPNMGHCLTSHYNATGGFKVITDYLQAHGL